MIESLESRQLLSSVVNLGGIIGPLKVGATYQYNVDVNGSIVGQPLSATEVDQVISAKFLGKKAIEIEKTDTSTADGTSSTLDQYLAPTAAGMYVYGQVQSGELDTVTTKYSPALIQLPRNVVAGHVYTFQYRSTQSIRINATGKTQTASYLITDKVKLVTKTPFALTVGSQSFQVYEVSVDETIHGVTSHAESWFSPGIGLVQTVSDGGTITLTSFTP